MEFIRVLQGDITKIPADVLVKPTEESGLEGLSVGQAKLLKKNCPSDSPVIYTAGPVWQGGHANEDELLASCYRSALHLALDHGMKTIAFSSLAKGRHNFPERRAARIALLEIEDFLEDHKGMEKIYVVCKDEDTVEIYRAALVEIDYGA